MRTARYRAAGAVEDARAMLIKERARKRPFSRALPQFSVLIRLQQFAPFVIGVRHRKRLG